MQFHALTPEDIDRFCHAFPEFMTHVRAEIAAGGDLRDIMPRALVHDHDVARFWAAVGRGVSVDQIDHSQILNTVAALACFSATDFAAIADKTLTIIAKHLGVWPDMGDVTVPVALN